MKKMSIEACEKGKENQEKKKRHKVKEARVKEEGHDHEGPDGPGAHKCLEKGHAF